VQSLRRSRGAAVRDRAVLARPVRVVAQLSHESAVNVYSRYSKRKRRGKLPYGTCRLTVCDVRIVQHLYGAIQEYGGFERPEWLG
jgi:hypothetical protein